VWVLTKRVLQVSIGGIVVASALGKALDLPGFVEVLRTYDAFPEGALTIMALLITFAEFLVGGWVLSGWRLRSGALVAALLNAGYMIWTSSALLRGLSLENCGCFGVFLPLPLTWISPLSDLIAVALCYLLSRLADPDRTSSIHAP
jgi:hypothetical protein